MSKQEGKVLSEFVHTWVNASDGKGVKEEVHRLIKPRKKVDC